MTRLAWELAAVVLSDPDCTPEIAEAVCAAGGRLADAERRRRGAERGEHYQLPLPGWVHFPATSPDPRRGASCARADERRATHPQGGARSCGNAFTMASVMVDEIRLRAHARPLDEPEP